MTSTVSVSSTVTRVATDSDASTITGTTTTTVFAPVGTQYDACAPNNFVTHINGMSICNVIFLYSAASIATDTAYDCCISCLQTALCGTAAFYSGTCFLSPDLGICVSTSENPLIDTAGTSNPYTVSNSNCGQAEYISGLLSRYSSRDRCYGVRFGFPVGVSSYHFCTWSVFNVVSLVRGLRLCVSFDLLERLLLASAA